MDIPGGSSDSGAPLQQWQFLRGRTPTTAVPQSFSGVGLAATTSDSRSR